MSETLVFFRLRYIESTDYEQLISSLAWNFQLKKREHTKKKKPHFFDASENWIYMCWI